MADSDISLNRGLQGIYLDRTNTTFIDGKEGVLEYSGYNIHDLAENSTFEETSYLLMYGNLPNTTQLEEFDKSLKSYRKLPQKTYDIIDIVKDSHPMDVLRTAISSLSSFSFCSGIILIEAFFSAKLFSFKFCSSAFKISSVRAFLSSTGIL